MLWPIGCEVKSSLHSNSKKSDKITRRPRTLNLRKPKPSDSRDPHSVLISRNNRVANIDLVNDSPKVVNSTEIKVAGNMATRKVASTAIREADSMEIKEATNMEVAVANTATGNTVVADTADR